MIMEKSTYCTCYVFLSQQGMANCEGFYFSPELVFDVLGAVA